MSMRFLSRTAALLALASLATAGFAWNDFGHMVVASIAERQLTFNAKTRILALIAIGGTPKTNSLLTAACWADDMRNRENGPWHYINYHFRTDGKSTTLGPAQQNVVWAIQKFSADAKRASTTELEKADALRHLLHYVGDIHQPLHCVARDTDAFPQGDRGGNEFKILPPKSMNPAPSNLHFLWDSGGGAFPFIERPLDAKGRDAVSEEAELAIKLNPESSFGNEIGIDDPHVWAKEGLALARRLVYKLEENTEPSKGYLEECQKASRRQAALAGYRLGRLLNALFEG